MDSLGISWRICGDNESARIFYKQLYLPHAQRRFGDHAVIFGLMKVRRLQRTGYLVMIFKDRELISGFICRIVGGRLVLELVGTAWTDEQPVSQVAGDAIYYVLLELARQLCCDRVDYRDCRPFMNDGVLRYKQQWGGVLSRQDTARRGIAISTPLQSPTGRRFFVGNYPIFEDGDGLSALLVLDGESPAGLRQLKRLEKAYLKPGLKRLGVSSPAGFEGEARRYLDAPGCRLADFEAIRI